MLFFLMFRADCNERRRPVTTIVSSAAAWSAGLVWAVAAGSGCAAGSVCAAAGVAVSATAIAEVDQRIERIASHIGPPKQSSVSLPKPSRATMTFVPSAYKPFAHKDLTTAVRCGFKGAPG